MLNFGRVDFFWPFLHFLPSFFSWCYLVDTHSFKILYIFGVLWIFFRKKRVWMVWRSMGGVHSPLTILRMSFNSRSVIICHCTGSCSLANNWDRKCTEPDPSRWLMMEVNVPRQIRRPSASRFRATQLRRRTSFTLIPALLQFYGPSACCVKK